VSHLKREHDLFAQLKAQISVFLYDLIDILILQITNGIIRRKYHSCCRELFGKITYKPVIFNIKASIYLQSYFFIKFSTRLLFPNVFG
jgi:hypothetical protein